MSTPIYKFLTLWGSDSAPVQATGAYQGGSEAFFYFRPAHAKRCWIHRMMIHIEDAGAFDATKYGNDIDLTKGIRVGVQRPNFASDGWDVEFTDGQAITSNAEWTRFCYDVDVKTWGVGNEVLAARWTFARSGQPIELDGGKDECLVVWLNDDFSALVDHTFVIQGLYDD